MLLGFVITVLLGRHLGAEELGLYRITSTLYGIAMLFGAVGIPGAIIKYVAEFKEDRNKLNRVTSSGIITSLFFGIGFAVLFYLLSETFAKIFDMPLLASMLKILSPVFPFALVGQTLLGFLNGLREMKKYAAATILQSVLMVIITVTLIYFGFGVAGAVLGIVFASIGFCLFLIWTTGNYYEFTLSEYILTTKRLLKFGVQIFGANAVTMVNYQADIVLIGYFLSARDLGYYTVAIGLSRFFWIIPQALQAIIYPATSEYWSKNNHAALQKMIDKSMKYIACILLPTGLGVGFFAKDVISMIFGEGFEHSVLPLQILITGTVIYGVIKAIGGSVTGVGRPDISLKIVSISAISNVVLNVVLIPYLGISGAAIATTVSLSMSTFIGLFAIIKIIKIKIDFKWYIKSSGLTLLLIFLFMNLYYINKYLIGLLILCVYIFIIIAFLLTKEDRIYFKELLHDTISYLKTIIQFN